MKQRVAAFAAKNNGHQGKIDRYKQKESFKKIKNGKGLRGVFGISP